MKNDTLLVVAILVGLWFVTNRGCDVPSIVAPVKPTAATYVYEKDDTAVPAPVSSAMNKLNRLGIVAHIFEDDTKDGTGDTPEPYKVPLAEAKKVGLPALVVTSGASVVKVLKDPKTEEAVLEAAQ